jgi:hypothetical protein
MKDTLANFETAQRRYDNRREPEMDPRSPCDVCEWISECIDENIPVNCPLNEEGE